MSLTMRTLTAFEAMLLMSLLWSLLWLLLLIDEAKNVRMIANKG